MMQQIEMVRARVMGVVRGYKRMSRQDKLSGRKKKSVARGEVNRVRFDR